MLVNPELSVNLAALHLRELYDVLGDWIMVAAAYNAGAGEARRWFMMREQRPTDELVEEISFDETRFYVKSVTATWWIYANVYSWTREAATIRSLIGPK